MAEDPSLAASVRELAARLAPAEALRAAAEAVRGRSRSSARSGARRAGLGRARARPPRGADRRRVGGAAAHRGGLDPSRARPRARGDRRARAGRGPHRRRRAHRRLGDGARRYRRALARTCRWRSRSGPISPRSRTARCSSSTASRACSRSIRRARSSRRREEALRQGSRRRRALAGLRGLPAETLDGRRITLLCNAASLAEIEAGLAAGAAGVGLLRTELAFLEAPAWPTEQQHRAALEPLLAALRGRVATVRTLDFGGDKTPPFLDQTPERGLALTLAQPDALAAQLRAIVHSGAATRLRILLPLVESRQQVRAVRSLLRDSLGEEQPVRARSDDRDARGCASRNGDRARGGVSLDRHERSRLEHARASSRSAACFRRDRGRSGRARARRVCRRGRA